MKKIKNIISHALFNILNKKRVLIVIVAFSISVLLGGSVSAYSIKLKNDGDIKYKNQNYEGALIVYKQSQKYWLPETVSYKLRDRDLYSKIEKTQIMIKSGENYIKGVNAFQNKQYVQAKQYLALLVLKDPKYQKAQKLLAIIEKESLFKPSISITKPYITSADGQSNSISITAPVTTAVVPTSVIPTPTLSYNDLHCPKVIRIEDNLGNTSTGADLNGTFKKGSINLLTVKVTATDPQNLLPYFQYQYTNFVENRSKIGADWSQNNSFTYDVTDAVPGVSKIISVYIDNQDGYRCSGGDYDVAVYFNYTITP